MNSVLHLLVCGGNMALLLNGQVVLTFDPELHDNAAAELFDRACESLPRVLNTTLVRHDLDVEGDDWTWDDVIEETGLALQGQPAIEGSTRPSESFRVTWAIDIDINEAANPIEAAKAALDAVKYGEETHYFTVQTPEGKTVDVDLDDASTDSLQAALERLDSHNDDDQDEPLYLYEVEVYLVSTDDPGTAIDQATVYCAAFNPEHAKEEAESIAKRESFTVKHDDEYVMIESVSQVDPEDHR